MTGFDSTSSYLVGGGRIDIDVVNLDRPFAVYCYVVEGNA
jgi:hypothetical protein